MGRALGGARRLLSASGAWQRSTRSACAPCAPHQATHSSVELLSQEVNVPADGSAQEPRSLTRHLQTLRSQERLTLDWCSPFARAEAGNDCVPQSRGQCGQLSHPQLQHQYRGGEREGFVTGALHRRGIAPSTASGHAIQAALITSARAHPAHSAHTQSHHEQQQQQQHVEGHQLRICELLQWASSNSCAIPPQSNRGSFSFLPTALSFQAPLLPAGRTPTRHLMEQTVHSTILPRAAAGVPARTFAKRPKKWHGDPWRFVEIEEGKEGEQVPASRPNAGSIGGRNQRRRMAQRETFKRVEHAKRKAQVVAANKAKAARHYATWRASFVRGLMKKKAARKAAAQAAAQ